MEVSVKLISITSNAQNLIGYCARVSSPHNQDNPVERLLRYCIRHGHWSPFEMAHMVVEINTTRAISAQLLRHKSFSFQEFSQRYAEVADEPEPPQHRLAGTTNRQSSFDPGPCGWTTEQMEAIVLSDKAVFESWKAYKRLVECGFATETARFVLPLCTSTRLYMAGNIRSFLHYCGARLTPDTQKEHWRIADDISKILEEEVPVIWKAYLKTLDPDLDQP